MVLVIIGIAATLITVKAIPDQQRLLQTEAERLSQLFQIASDEATLRASPVAWIPSANGYVFTQQLRDGQQTIEEDLLKPRRWNVGPMMVSIEIDGVASQQFTIQPEGYAQSVLIRLRSEQASIYLVNRIGGRFNIQTSLPGNKPTAS